MRGEPLPVTSVLTAFQGFKLRDGTLGLMWPGKCGAAVNRRPSVGKGTIDETPELRLLCRSQRANTNRGSTACRCGILTCYYYFQGRRWHQQTYPFGSGFWAVVDGGGKIRY